MSFWVMQREPPFDLSNFDENEQSDVDYLNAIFARLQSLYTQSNEMWCDGGSSGYLNPTDTRIRFQLEGPIHFIQDEQGWTNGTGSNGNSYSFEHHSECPDEILHVYFCESATNISGIAPSFNGTPYIVLYDLYNDYFQNGLSSYAHGNLIRT
ncbi:MAG: hypothetical protein K9I85_14080 [Saprospiraceae bacterium]|nr:hypothetical protein [Saprospiraceae bacterium]